LRAALWQHRTAPALAVLVVVPPTAEDLLLRPFELARFANGTSFREAGVRFVYQIEGAHVINMSLGFDFPGLVK
jgi:hypothetical protein